MILRYRWFIIAGVAFIILYLFEDITGRVAWKEYHKRWERFGLTIDGDKSNPADQNFWQSKIMREWEARSPNYDPAIVDVMAGSYRPSMVVTKASWRDRQLTEFPSPPGDALQRSLNKAKSEDLAHEAIFISFANGCERPPGGDFGNEVPNLERVNDSAIHARDRVAVSLHTDDPERACRDLIAMIEFANHWQEQSLVGLLVNLAICRIVGDSIWEGLAMEAYDDTQLLRLQKAMQKARLTKDFALMAYSEMGWTRNLINSADLRNQLLASGGRASLSSPGDILDVCINALEASAPRGHHMHVALDHFSLWDSVTIDSQGNLPGQLTIDQVDRWTTWKPGWRSQLSIFGPATPRVGKIGTITLETQQLFDFGIIACALEIYRKANGEYPNQLALLKPDFISALPVDQFQPSIPIRYQLNDGRYQLIASGVDRKDDGGNLTDDLVWRYYK